MAELRQRIQETLWKEHFIDDRVSGVTFDECGLLADRVMEILRRDGVVQSPRA